MFSRGKTIFFVSGGVGGGRNFRAPIVPCAVSLQFHC